MIKKAIYTIIITFINISVLTAAQSVRDAWKEILESSGQFVEVMDYQPRSLAEIDAIDTTGYGADGALKAFYEQNLKIVYQDLKNPDISRFRTIFHNTFESCESEAVIFFPRTTGQEDLPIAFAVRGGWGRWGLGAADQYRLWSMLARMGYVVVAPQLSDNHLLEAKLDECGGRDVDGCMYLLDLMRNLPHLKATDGIFHGFSRGGMMVSLMVEKIRSTGRELPVKVVLSSPMVNVQALYDATQGTDDWQLRELITREITRRKDSSFDMPAALAKRVIVSKADEVFQGIPTLGLGAQSDQILPKEQHLLAMQEKLLSDTTVPHIYAICPDTGEPCQHYIKFSKAGYGSELAVTEAFLRGDTPDFKAHGFSSGV